MMTCSWESKDLSFALFELSIDDLEECNPPLLASPPLSKFYSASLLAFGIS